MGVASILFCHFASFLELLTSRSLCAECIGSSIIENIVYMTNLSSGLHVTKQGAEPKVHGIATTSDVETESWKNTMYKTVMNIFLITMSKGKKN